MFLKMVVQKNMDSIRKNVFIRLDGMTKRHSYRVTRLSYQLAVAIGIKGRQLENIVLAALLHDVGKINIPNSILNKPGKLTPTEWEIIKQHPVTGSNITSRLGFSRDITDIIVHHHERYDGTGYPNNLKASQIPLASRIISIADSFDAMTSGRVYKRKMLISEALKEFEKCSGSQFDPFLVETFIKLVGSNCTQPHTRRIGAFYSPI